MGKGTYHLKMDLWCMGINASNNVCEHFLHDYLTNERLYAV